jgi:penicillin-binding protein 1B
MAKKNALTGQTAPKAASNSKTQNRGNWGRRLGRGLFKLLVKTALWISLVIILIGAGYLYYLDRNISKTFEGRRWSVPAQIYAQPLELFPGKQLTNNQLQDELERLGYRKTTDLSAPGSYQPIPGGTNIHLRSFAFMEATRPSTKLQVMFVGRQVQRMNTNGKPLNLIRLEPAVIGSFFPSHGEDRVILAPGQVPDLLANGLKAVEDRTFDEHKGFSITGIARAALINLRSGERQQGGSTLTQQLVKSYFLTNERTIERKLRELAMAIILEMRFSKEDLLTAYINEIFLGQNGARAIHGFGLGAQYYFNKPLNELPPDQIATLISIIRGPSYYNPFRHPERTLERRNRILDTFQKDGLISPEVYQGVIDKPLGVVDSANSGGAYYPAFMDLVRMELRERYSANDLRSQGLRIFTTLNPRTQENAQQAVSQTLEAIERQRGSPQGSLQASTIVADTQTGEVLALVGGRRGRVDGFNRALNAQRPVGSVLKPLIVLTALENGYEWSSIVNDEEITLTPPNGEAWSPRNYDGKTRGELPIIKALALSLNLATVDLGNRVGLDAVQSRFRDLLGYAPKNRYPSFFLGAEAMSPLRLLELYGNFASGGFRVPPKSVIAVLDEQGQPLSHYPFELEQTIDPDIAMSLNQGLEIVMRRGTGRTSPYAKQGVAGKTGTSNDNRDSWFAGFDNSKLSVVWVGRDDNNPTGLTGSSGAMRIWNAMMRDEGSDPFIALENENSVAIEYDTGLRATDKCADVVVLPIARPDTLSIKPGCNVKSGFGERLRSIFSR